MKPPSRAVLERMKRNHAKDHAEGIDSHLPCCWVNADGGDCQGEHDSDNPEWDYDTEPEPYPTPERWSRD